jgi:hypothetical protein
VPENKRRIFEIKNGLERKMKKENRRQNMECKIRKHI